MGTLESLVKDPWKDIRKDMYRNIEPKVELVALTQPLERLAKQGVTSGTLPAYCSRHCWESNKKYSEDAKENNEIDQLLTKRLLEMDHGTPFQATEYVFEVDGISKALQTQWVRHKIGVGWSFRSTRFVKASDNTYVYNTYDYIKEEEKVRELLKIDEEMAKTGVAAYDKKIALGATKQDARKFGPYAFSGHCAFFANARAIRHLMKLRLEKHAEWEIRRMCAMMLDELMRYTPEIFQDIYDKYSAAPAEQK